MLYFLPFNLVQGIELTKKSWVDTMITELAMEEDAPMLKR